VSTTPTPENLRHLASSPKWAGKTSALLAAADRIEVLEAEASLVVDAMWSVMSACEGHRYGQSDYDITLDDIYEVASAARSSLRSVIKAQP